jgi:hypothetical protein
MISSGWERLALGRRDVLTQDPDAATLAWTDLAGIVLTRRFALRDRTLRIETHLDHRGRAPMPWASLGT